MAMPPRFDFSLNLDLIGEVNSQDSGPKSAKDKDAKRLARCGKCNNCKSQVSFCALMTVEHVGPGGARGAR